MNSMIQGIKQFVQEEDGASGVEYALLLCMVALVLAGLYTNVSGAVQGVWNNIVNSLTANGGAAG